MLNLKNGEKGSGMKEAGIEKSVDALIAVGISVFVLVIVLSLMYQGYAQTKIQINHAFNNPSISNSLTSASANAVNDSAANTLTVDFTGSYAWISSSTPLTIALTGNSISSYASNTAYAVPGNTETQTFSVTSDTALQTLTSTTGNFYNISSIDLGGITSGAYPSFTAKITQSFSGVLHGSAPSSFVTNTISATAQGTSTYASPGIVANFTANGGGVANTFGSNVGLAVFVVVMAVVILAIILALRNRGGTGFLGA